MLTEYPTSRSIRLDVEPYDQSRDALVSPRTSVVCVTPAGTRKKKRLVAAAKICV